MTGAPRGDGPRDSVAGLVDGSLAPGIYRVLDDPATIEQALTAAGWSVAVIDPAERSTVFFHHLASGLGLPGYFGANLDALWDVLTDLTRPTALVLPEWTRLARARPDRWAAIVSVLGERCAQQPAFAVVLA